MRDGTVVRETARGVRRLRDIPALPTEDASKPNPLAVDMEADVL